MTVETVPEEAEEEQLTKDDQDGTKDDEQGTKNDSDGGEKMGSKNSDDELEILKDKKIEIEVRKM